MVSNNGKLYARKQSCSLTSTISSDFRRHRLRCVGSRGKSGRGRFCGSKTGRSSFCETLNVTVLWLCSPPRDLSITVTLTSIKGNSDVSPPPLHVSSITDAFRTQVPSSLPDTTQDSAKLGAQLRKSNPNTKCSHALLTGLMIASAVDTANRPDDQSKSVKIRSSD